VSPEDLLAKAQRAADSARLLLNAGDADGACNRAYYAMFDAARAALAAEETGSASGDDTMSVRSHSGLISAFGLRLIKSGRLPLDLGRTLNRAAEIRAAADYTGGPIDNDKASWMVARAQTFIDEVRALLNEGRSSR
jgi:uncharacterized protein (UPF0332 family)